MAGRGAWFGGQGRPSSTPEHKAGEPEDTAAVSHVVAFSAGAGTMSPATPLGATHVATGGPTHRTPVIGAPAILDFSDDEDYGEGDEKEIDVAAATPDIAFLKRARAGFAYGGGSDDGGASSPDSAHAHSSATPATESPAADSVSAPSSEDGSPTTTTADMSRPARVPDAAVVGDMAPSASTAAPKHGKSESKYASDSKAAPTPAPTPAFLSPTRVPSTRSGSLKRCYVVRNRKGLNRLFPVYCLYEEGTAEEGGDGTPAGSDKLICMAKKQPGNKTANFHIFDMRTVGASGATRLNKSSDAFVGKLRANFKNSQLSLFGRGTSRSDASSAAELRPEMMAMTFRAAPSADGVVPRKLEAILPPVGDDNRPELWRQRREGESLMARLLASRFNEDGTVHCVTKDPVLINGTYHLNFHGRVKLASVKNFQFVRSSPDDAASAGGGDAGKARSGPVLLQFGKVSSDVFNLDFKAPFSAVQAFAVALAQFNA